MYFNTDDLPYGDGVPCSNCLSGDNDFYSNEYYGFPYFDGISNDPIEVDTTSYYLQQQQQQVMMPMDGDNSNMVLATNPDPNCTYENCSTFIGVMDNNTIQPEMVEDTTPRKRCLENDIEMFTGCYPPTSIPNDDDTTTTTTTAASATATVVTISTTEGTSLSMNTSKACENQSQHPKVESAASKRNKSGGRTRVAAHEFRQKQKLYIYSLEKRVAELTAVNAEMQSRLHLMSNENNIIKEHLAYLRGFIAQAVPPSSLPDQESTSTTTSSTTITTLP